ncbi:conserved hypothetical protein [delta proteobacterium NaphS2]|nr:conserved hypothetical protein [delta proteobacterium NaphS2]
MPFSGFNRTDATPNLFHKFFENDIFLLTGKKRFCKKIDS